MSQPMPVDGQPSQIERELGAIWKDLLHVEIDARSDFFLLGGDSLQMMSMISSASERLGMELSPSMLFEYPTLGALVRYIEATQGSSPEAVYGIV
jgi:acyl carrier protein